MSAPTTYTSALTERQVRISPPAQSDANDIQIARFLADSDRDVALRTIVNQDKVLTADAWVFENFAWQGWEFKIITAETTNVGNRAREDLIVGRKQAPTVLLWLRREVADDNAVERINRALPYIVRYD